MKYVSVHIQGAIETGLVVDEAIVLLSTRFPDLVAVIEGTMPLGPMLVTPDEIGPRLADMAEAGTLDLSVFDHRVFPLDRINDAISGMPDRAAGFTNVVVSPWGGAPTFNPVTKAPERAAAGATHMMDDLKSSSILQPSRRTIVKGGAAALASATVFSPAVLRAATPVIKIGHVSPQTGPMAGFAEAQSWVLDGIRGYLKDGLTIGGKTYPVEIITKDSQTDEARTSEVASDLILKHKVNIITASSGSPDTNPVANQAELNEIPCITTDNPWESYFYGRNGDPKVGFDYTYHFFWGLDQVLAAFIGLWQGQSTNKTIGLLFNTDQDDVSWHAAFVPAIRKAGFNVVDPGLFPAFGNDFTPQITMFKKNNVDIVTGNLFTPDFATFWSQSAQQGFNPKVVTLGKAFLFPADVASLGPRGVGVTSEVWWAPQYPFVSSLTSINGHDLVASYEKDTGRHWTQPIPFKHALFEVVIDVLKRTKDVTDTSSIMAAIDSTDMKTIVGPVKWPGPLIKNISTTPVVAGQWQKHGDRLDIAIVNSGAFPEIKTDSPLLPLA